jgi:hypothetical protein
MKNLFLLICFCFYSSFTFSQKDTVGYTLLEDNPEFNFISGGMDIINVSFDNNAWPWGTGGSVQFEFDPIYGALNYCFAGSMANWVQDPTGNANNGAISIYKNRDGGTKSEISGYVGYSFKKWKEKGKAIITLANRSKVTVVTSVDATYEKKYALELGFKKGFSYYQSVVDGGGNGFMAVPYLANDQLGNSNPIQLNAGTTLEYTVVNLGFSFIKKHDVVIDVEDYGHKRGHSFMRFYGRLSFLINSNLDDVHKPVDDDWDNGSPHFKYNINDNTPMNKVGFNLGISSQIPKGLGGYRAVEFGYFPGPKVGITNNLYLFGKVGFSFAALFKK